MKTRLLITEDDVIVSMLLEDYVSELGYNSVQVARNTNSALALVQSTPPDLALLDIDLQGDRSCAIADKLSELGIPFAFCSGYTADNVPERHRHRPVLLKPYTMRDLRAVLSGLQTAGRLQPLLPPST